MTAPSDPTDYQKRLLTDALEFNTIQLERNPTNAHAHTQLAKALLYQSKTSEALSHLQKAGATRLITILASSR